MVEQRNIDWFKIKQQLPLGNSAEEQNLRKQYWRQVDINGNGYVSLAELDKWLRDFNCYQIYDCKPCIIRAFNEAKEREKTKHIKKNKPRKDYYLTEGEFQRCLQYLRLYFEYFQAFARIDTGDDRRIDRNEFRAAVKNDHIFNVPVKDPDAEFKKIDKNRGGQILFEEFVDWAFERKLDLEDDDDYDVIPDAY